MRQPIHVVIRPVDSPRRHVSSMHKLISKFSKDVADIGALITLASVSHRAVIVEDIYYHLKRMPDDSLGLDLTPFSDESELVKFPISKTSLSHTDRLGIAVTVISEMMDNRIPPKSVPVLMHGNRLPQHGQVSYSNYEFGYEAFVKGNYNTFFNNCITFCRLFLRQLRPPSPLDELVIKKELMEEYLTKDRVAALIRRLRHIHVGERAEHFLKVPIEE